MFRRGFALPNPDAAGGTEAVAAAVRALCHPRVRREAAFEQVVPERLADGGERHRLRVAAPDEDADFVASGVTLTETLGVLAPVAATAATATIVTSVPFVLFVHKQSFDEDEQSSSDRDSCQLLTQYHNISKIFQFKYFEPQEGNMSVETSAPTRVVVRHTMNDHHTMTVEVEGSNETRHLVDYANPDLRRTLAALPSGTAIPVTLSRAGARSNVWRVEALHHEAPAGGTRAAPASN